MTVAVAPLGILVVDDEISVKYLCEMNFRKAIQKGQVEFHFFESGEACLHFLSHHRGEWANTALITDINMPLMNGFELLERVRGGYPEISVYMMSAYDDEGTLNKAHSLGVRGYFTKPVDYRFLKQQLGEHFKVSFS